MDARDLADAAKKIESAAISYRKVIAEEMAEETQKAEPATIH